MLLRSLLFVPGESEKKLAKAASAGADALILDLEDAVAPERKSAARSMVRDFLRDQRSVRSQLWVRINPLDSAMAIEDLAAVVPAAPAGLILPKVNSPSELLPLESQLDELEAREGLAPRSTKIIVIATETARAPFALGAYAEAGLQRLGGLTWGAEDLSTALGASTNLDATGSWAFTFRMVRSMCLLAAKACGVEAIETLHANFKDMAGLRSSSIAARQEGFTGRLAIHPDQVPVINEAFTPSSEEVAHARRVLEAFAAAPQAGAVSLDGRMVDIPHLKQARELIARYERSAEAK